MIDRNNYTIKHEVPERIDLALKDIAYVESFSDLTNKEHEKFTELKLVLKKAKDICEELTR